MKPLQQSRQPSQGEIQPLFHLLNTGRLAQAETQAASLLRQYPNAFILYNVLGVAQEGQQKYKEAAATYSQALALEPGIAEIHVNLGAVLGHLSQTEEAITSYRKAIALRPDLTVAYFNLGIILQEHGGFDEAVAAYRKAIALEPGFYEAIGNLGTVLQKQGKLEEATALYRKALAIHEDARGHFNLGTALRDEGKHEEAAEQYLKALALNPDYADAHNNLGEIFRDQGNMNDAILCYQNAMAIAPDHPNANYNMGELHALAREYEQAIPYFERSRYEDYQERAMECMYRIGRIDEFREKLKAMVASGRKSMMLATLSTHHATNYGVKDDYNFCPDPMRFAWHTSIPELAEPGSPLLQDILGTIDRTPIAARKQGRLYSGMQSAGNLLKRPEPAFQKLAALVRQKIAEYRDHYADENCDLIRYFPEEIDFSSSWYLKMKKGGNLGSHIHEEGWISGCVYLKLPTVRKDPTEAAFEYGTHGDNYPCQHDNFPSQVVIQKVGDIVLFPSSLFHHTIPFNSDEDRVCVAFDLKPAAPR
jgi:tetratricopeptide (TPR) repeat protein